MTVDELMDLATGIRALCLEDDNTDEWTTGYNAGILRAAMWVQTMDPKEASDT